MDQNVDSRRDRAGALSGGRSEVVALGEFVSGHLGTEHLPACLSTLSCVRACCPLPEGRCLPRVSSLGGNGVTMHVRLWRVGLVLVVASMIAGDRARLSAQAEIAPLVIVETSSA